MNRTEYGSWEQYQERLREESRKGKDLFGVGCHDCIPKGYTGCEGCEEAYPVWLASHQQERLYHERVPILEAGIRMAGL